MARWCDLIYKGDGCYLGYPPDAARDAHDKKQLRDEKKYIFSSSRVSPESNGVLCTANRLTVHDKKNATVVIWDPTDIPSELQITELSLSLESTRARDVQRQCRTFFSRLCVRFFCAKYEYGDCAVRLLLREHQSYRLADPPEAPAPAATLLGNAPYAAKKDSLGRSQRLPRPLLHVGEAG